MSAETARDVNERERCEHLMRDRLAVFVFGSNRRGVHGAGAASVAQRCYGAKRGVGEGPCGRSYAIPTKETWRDAGLPLAEIAVHVAKFLDYARLKWAAMFVVTRVGCGLAGYTEAEIAPLFANAPPNCMLPDGWRSKENGND